MGIKKIKNFRWEILKDIEVQSSFILQSYLSLKLNQFSIDYILKSLGLNKINYYVCIYISISYTSESNWLGKL